MIPCSEFEGKPAYRDGSLALAVTREDSPASLPPLVADSSDDDGPAKWPQEGGPDSDFCPRCKYPDYQCICGSRALSSGSVQHPPKSPVMRCHHCHDPITEETRKECKYCDIPVHRNCLRPHMWLYHRAHINEIDSSGDEMTLEPSPVELQPHFDRYQ